MLLPLVVERCGSGRYDLLAIGLAVLIKAGLTVGCLGDGGVVDASTLAGWTGWDLLSPGEPAVEAVEWRFWIIVLVAGEGIRLG